MRNFTFLLIATSLISGAAFAGNDWDPYSTHGGPQWKQRDFAIIRNVTPQYEQISQPRQECNSEWVTETLPAPRAPNSVAGTILGGAAGGAIGHQIGKGRGKAVATVAGTIIGALVGEQIADPYNATPTANTVSREVQRCRQVNDYAQRVRDYRVDYEYRSQIYSTTMNRYPGEPGSRLPVRVMVELDD